MSNLRLSEIDDIFIGVFINLRFVGCSVVDLLSINAHGFGQVLNMDTPVGEDGRRKETEQNIADSEVVLSANKQSRSKERGCWQAFLSDVVLSLPFPLLVVDGRVLIKAHGAD